METYCIQILWIYLSIQSIMLNVELSTMPEELVSTEEMMICSC